MKYEGEGFPFLTSSSDSRRRRQALDTSTECPLFTSIDQGHVVQGSLAGGKLLEASDGGLSLHDEGDGCLSEGCEVKSLRYSISTIRTKAKMVFMANKSAPLILGPSARE